MSNRDNSIMIRGADGSLYYIRGEELEKYKLSDEDAKKIAGNIDVSGSGLLATEEPEASKDTITQGHFTAAHFTAGHFTTGHFTAAHFTAAHFTAGHFTDADFNPGHFTSFVNVGKRDG